MVRAMFCRYCNVMTIRKSLLQSVAPSIVRALTKSLAMLYTHCRDPFDHDLNTVGFETNCNLFMKDIIKCESEIEDAIVGHIKKARSTSTAINIFQRIPVVQFLPNPQAREMHTLLLYCSADTI